MPTVTFTIPADVRQVFDATFHERCKAAIIAGLMMEAVERERGRQRSRQRNQDAIRRILARCVDASDAATVGAGARTQFGSI